ncbi:MAG: GntR family transcriptional regulator [Candidatus Hydrogenedentes bacterium]|nr:GntR family transcriptional regulator [Candidatus Hydrogenedentota bacterium]
MARNGSPSEQIKQVIRQMIEKGVFGVGQPVPSELELAAQYNVGRAHSRQALRDLESEGYILRSRGRRSIVAPKQQWPGRALTSVGENVVALALPTYQSRYCQAIQHGLFSVISERGYQSIAYNLSFDETGEPHFLKHVSSLGLRALALWIQNETPETENQVREIAESGLPVVLVDHEARQTELDAVTTDNEQLGEELTRALLQRGHERVGFLRDTYNLMSTEERQRGFTRALAEAGITYQEAWGAAFNPHHGDEVIQAVDMVMARRNPPTAFYCSHDALAQVVADRLNVLGYRLGEDIEIATSDDDGLLQERGVPAILMRQPGYAIGRKAGELLLERIADPSLPPRVVRLAPEWVCRSNGDPIAAE